MMKVTVAYWSGTGNTEKMAHAVAGGAGTQALRIGDLTPEQALRDGVLALGCPSMGDEVLEENEMEPFVAALENSPAAKGVKLALFGSYGWGDGKWMRDWQERMKKAGFILAHDALIVQGEPDAEGLLACKNLGAALAAAN
ncbi:MAG: flavodoxin [Elusimicrobia bacterium]|nr:flavodoxin [Elusimicrobiota bacterium]